MRIVNIITPIIFVVAVGFSQIDPSDTVSDTGRIWYIEIDDALTAQIEPSHIIERLTADSLPRGLVYFYVPDSLLDDAPFLEAWIEVPIELLSTERGLESPNILCTALRRSWSPSDVDWDDIVVADTIPVSAQLYREIGVYDGESGVVRFECSFLLRLWLDGTIANNGVMIQPLDVRDEFRIVDTPRLVAR